MATAKKKQDEKHLKILRELVSLPANKQCFDCHQRGPTYVNMTIGSFVCTSCSGMLRGLTPPHRVKSISMASFSPEEVELIKARGNEYCKQIWLGLYDPSHPQNSKDEQQMKDFMVAKYERKRYYVDPTTIPRISSASNAAVVAAAAAVAAASSSPGGVGAASPVFSSPEAQLRSRSRTSTPQSVGGGSSDGQPGRPASAASLQQRQQANAHQATPQPTALPTTLPLVPSMQAPSSSHDNMFTPDKSCEFLADFGAADPFSASLQVTSASSQQPSFANFDNNPVFSSSSDQLFGLLLQSEPLPSKCNTNRWSMPTAAALQSLGPTFGSPAFGGPARKATSSMGVNHPLGAMQPPSEDRYAALKDLDSLMKSQQQQQQQQQQPAMATAATATATAAAVAQSAVQGTAADSVIPVAADWASAFMAATSGLPWTVSVAPTASASAPVSAPMSGFGLSTGAGVGGLAPATPLSTPLPNSAFTDPPAPNPFGGVGTTLPSAVDPWAPSVAANGVASGLVPSGTAFSVNPFRPSVSRRPSQPGFGPLPEGALGWGAEAVPNGAILAGAMFPTSQSMNFPAKAWHPSVGNPFALGASPAATGRSSNPFL